MEEGLEENQELGEEEYAAGVLGEEEEYMDEEAAAAAAGEGEGTAAVKEEPADGEKEGKKAVAASDGKATVRRRYGMTLFGDSSVSDPYSF
jgi:hypothetical protein